MLRPYIEWLFWLAYYAITGPRFDPVDTFPSVLRYRRRIKPPWRRDQINADFRYALLMASFARKITMPLCITNDELDRAVETNLPVKTVDRPKFGPPLFPDIIPDI